MYVIPVTSSRLMTTFLASPNCTVDKSIIWNSTSLFLNLFCLLYNIHPITPTANNTNAVLCQYLFRLFNSQ